MIWAAPILFALIGLGFIVRRHDMARMQSLVAGGRLGAGCAVAEGVLLLLMALAAVVMNRYGLFD
jgi:predicted membrane-bound mannosyltransferase